MREMQVWHDRCLGLWCDVRVRVTVQEVIETFPSSQRQRWRNAAVNLRMPYWDWAQDGGSNTVPTVIRDSQVTVEKPQG